MLNVALQHQVRGCEAPLRLELELKAGERLAVFGDTGAGKTTLLRLVAGLERPDSGRIACGGSTWFDAGRRIDLPVRARRLGFAFQDGALLPQMSLRENLAFAQAASNPAALDEILALTELAEFAARRPAQLSGGQRQRAALARALAVDAPLWLLDEALSAQDAATRLRLRERLDARQRQRGATLLFVSHDLGEVFHLADRVLHLRAGAVVALGAPREVLLAQSGPGRYALRGSVLTIEPADVMMRVTIAIGSDVVSTLVGRAVAAQLAPGRPAQLLLNGSSALVIPLAS